MLQDANNSFIRGFYEIAISYIPDGSRVLNLGCGRKFNFEKLLSQKKNVNIESIDIGLFPFLAPVNIFICKKL